MSSGVRKPAAELFPQLSAASAAAVEHLVGEAQDLLGSDDKAMRALIAELSAWVASEAPGAAEGPQNRELQK